MHWFTQHPTREKILQKVQEKRRDTYKGFFGHKGNGEELQEGEEGKRQDQEPQARKAVQEVRMGVRAFRPPPNLMRVGKSP